MKIKPSLWALMLMTLSLLGCNNEDNGLLGGEAELPEATLDLVVSPEDASIPVGFTQDLRAEVVFPNGQTEIVTTRDEITWTSSNEAIATVDSNGVVSGISVGEATIYATGFKDGVKYVDSATIYVTEAVISQLSISPLNSSVPVGVSLDYTATATFSDGSTQEVADNPLLTWRIESVSGEASLHNPDDDDNKINVVGEQVGEVIVKASGVINEQMFEASTRLDITDAIVESLDISPDDSSIPIGGKETYEAKATFSDGSVKNVTDNELVQWSVEAFSGSATLKNDSQSDNIVEVIGEGEGSVQVNAKASFNGIELIDSVSLTITGAVVTDLVIKPENAEVQKGSSLPFSAIAMYSDGHTSNVSENVDLEWTTVGNPDAPEAGEAIVQDLVSGDDAVDIKGTSQGSVIVMASYTVAEDNYEASTTLEVTDVTVESLTVTPSPETVYIDGLLSMTAVAHFSDSSSSDVTKDVRWQTDDGSIITIDQDGVVRGVKKGTAKVIASSAKYGMASATVHSVEQYIMQAEDNLVDDESKEGYFSDLPSSQESEYNESFTFNFPPTKNMYLFELSYDDDGTPTDRTLFTGPATWRCGNKINDELPIYDDLDKVYYNDATKQNEGFIILNAATYYANEISYPLRYDNLLTGRDIDTNGMGGKNNFRVTLTFSCFDKDGKRVLNKDFLGGINKIVE